jgi:hypothetical protein
MDNVTRLYGEKPSPEQILEMARFKGVTYQKKGNDNTQQQNIPKVITPTENLNLDLGNWISNAKVLVPISDLIKIPSQKDKLLKAIEGPNERSLGKYKSKEHHEDAPVIINSMDWTREDHPPFFVSLKINDLLLHNCMYDSGASSNIITKNVMNMLNLKITRPYHNVCAMDSREVETHGIILNLQVKLAAYPNITFPMDILVIDVPDAWGMLLSRKWVATLGGTLQMDLSYATIPSSENSFVKLHREKERKFHVEDPKEPMNEFVYHMHEIGNYEIPSDFLAPVKERFKDELPNVCNVWDTMDSFDGLFLEEAPSKVDSTHSESGFGLNLSVGSALSASICQLSDKSFDGQDELDRIFGPSTPYVLEPGDIYFGKEDTFDRQNDYKNEKIEKPDDHIEVNVKSDQDLRMIKIRKGISKKRRKNGINIVKDLTDDIVFDEVNSKEYAKPFKEKIKRINCKLFPKAQRKVFNNSSQPVGRQKVKSASERAPP